ncbi:hypothetical protein D8B26_003538 [Coccidioides posadasii str. Silveira]|uniref:Choline transporter n=1 Tax=Coccidioides posadasii (strain RMSCC 757 / Silveira) TaxID=443226 RepID=E9D0X6_COCPS|nr:choline transporter [Coccidioides posadasii str. Silveira]QVM08865.1 hypothetical protein D8B26_003538 [Coccidioides posadasii str. Silveira]
MAHDSMVLEEGKDRGPAPSSALEKSGPAEVVVNASGHKQELERNFSLLSICGVGITTGNTWIAMGGSISVAIFNGGPPGIIYEFIVVAICYWFVAASVAELASAIPSAAGVYHWASMTAGKRYGRPVGFFAGYWNCLAWMFGAASISSILGNQLLAMYTLFHPEREVQPWNVFVVYIVCTIFCCATVLFGNRFLPYTGHLGSILIIGGVIVSILVCATMPHVNGLGYASNSFVWKDWQNQTGYESNAFVFLAGMLNGAYTVGALDVTSHMAEEIPRPSRNIPKAILAQMVIGFVTAIPYMVALLYAINDLDAVLTTNTPFPLAEIYYQATGSRGGALGLLIVMFFPTFLTCIGCYLTAGRTLWTLARDNATPFSPWMSRINPTFRNPFNATLACGAVVVALGCIYVGSKTAFNAFVGSFAVLSSLSYVTAILPHLLSGRRSINPGRFYMKGPLGFLVNGISCSYVIAFVVIFCFPYALPTDAETMNYTSLITGGLSIFVAIWWFVTRSSYKGPNAIPLGEILLAPEVHSV